MRIALVTAVFALLVVGRGAFAEDLSGKLAELENGAQAPSSKVQIVPGVDQPQLTPTAEPEPEPEAAAPLESGIDPEEGSEEGQDEDGLDGESVSGGAGLTVEPRVQNTTKP